MTDDRSRANRSPVTLAIGHRSSVIGQTTGQRGAAARPLTAEAAAHDGVPGVAHAGRSRRMGLQNRRAGGSHS